MFLLTNREIEARALDPEAKKLYNALTTTDNAVTASTGSTQATGYVVKAAVTRVTTVGTVGDALTLPKAVSGVSLVVINAAAANSMDVFPAVGDSINALAADAALAVAANKTVLFVCAVGGVWNAVVTA
jgi:hypothetical protein